LFAEMRTCFTFSWIFTKMKENSLDARRVDKKKRIVSAQSSLHAAHFNSLCAKKLPRK